MKNKKLYFAIIAFCLIISFGIIKCVFWFCLTTPMVDRVTLITPVTSAEARKILKDPNKFNISYKYYYECAYEIVTSRSNFPFTKKQIDTLTWTHFKWKAY